MGHQQWWGQIKDLWLERKLVCLKMASLWSITLLYLRANWVFFKDVVREIVNTVNFFRSYGFNHREFQQFLSEMEAEHGLCILLHRGSLAQWGKGVEESLNWKIKLVNSWHVKETCSSIQCSWVDDWFLMLDWYLLASQWLERTTTRQKPVYTQSVWPNQILFRTDFFYGKVRFKIMTSHTFQPYHNDLKSNKTFLKTFLLHVVWTFRTLPGLCQLS
jgi:hypothetical protein